MQLDLSDEQVLLADSVRDMLEVEYGRAGREASLAHPQACRPELWQQFSELGWLMLPLPEAAGGLGGGMLETGLLMRAFGRSLVVEPYLASAVTASWLLAGLDDPQADRWLTAAREGEGRVVLAHGELGVRDPFAAPVCQALRVGADGWVLSGFKPLVAGVPGAMGLLVSACDPLGRTGIFAVATDAAGLRTHACRLADGGLAADLYLDQVPAFRLGATAQDSLPLLQRTQARTLVALCWEVRGAMDTALEGTLGYTATRRQFGQPLAQFQVVQHRLAEMQVACEEALAACQLAALRIDREPHSLDVAIDAALLAKSKVGRSARFVSQEAVQLHGAMGVCEELPIAAVFRKLTAFGQQLGSTGFASALLGRHQLASGAWRNSQTLASPLEDSSS